MDHTCEEFSPIRKSAWIISDGIARIRERVVEIVLGGFDLCKLLFSVLHHCEEAVPELGVKLIDLYIK